MNENAFVRESPMFYGRYQVVYPDGQTENCYNLSTARALRDQVNSRAGKKKEYITEDKSSLVKEQPMNDKPITTIQGVIDVLEEILEPMTDIHERRPIIQVIEFCKRQQDAGRPLIDIIYWLQRELPKGLDKALGID